MKNYLSEIEKIINANTGEFDTIAVVNKDGIIEYTKTLRPLPPDMDIALFSRNVIGKHILTAYSTLKEEESTVMRTLKTGKITSIDRQILCTGDKTVVISAITYPIFDEFGEIQGVVDATRLLEYIDDSRRENVEERTVLDSIITCNAEMMKIKETVAEVAKTDSPVFLYGETGTGKELVARALHRLSRRKNRPFISQNCAAIPPNLLESTFFGTEKGGFTGAESKQGLFELADGGTLFLDEINSMEVMMQTKLLKALEEQQVRKIGGEKDVFFDVRIICAANEYPADLIRAGRIREDFYYRVSVIKINLPPLRYRRDDIMLLTDFFIRFYNEKMSKNIQGVSSMVADLFLRWKWPGNIRELRSTIESAFNRESGSIITLYAVMDLLSRMGEEGPQRPDSEKMPSAGTALPGAAEEETLFMPLQTIREKLQVGKIDLQKLLEDYERSIISEAMRQNPRLTAVAEKLSMSPQKLNYRISKLRLK